MGALVGLGTTAGSPADLRDGAGDLNPDLLHAMRAFARSLTLCREARQVNGAGVLSEIDHWNP
jgi:hypothetical protein